jgi:hypothetical protein
MRKKQRELVEAYDRGEADPQNSAVAQALGVRAREQQIRAESRQRETELVGRAVAAGVEVKDLGPADHAIAVALEARGEIDGNAASYRQLVDFVETSAPSVPGYAFAIATAYAAGKGAK